MSLVETHSSDGRTSTQLRVNYCTGEELRCIPGVGAQLADTIVLLRMSHGNMDPELLSKLIRRPITPSTLAKLDFTPNPKYDGYINDYGTWGRALLTPEAHRSDKEGGVSTPKPSRSSRRRSPSVVKAESARRVSFGPDLMTLRIDREVRDMEKSLTSSWKPWLPPADQRDYSAIRSLDPLYTGELETPEMSDSSSQISDCHDSSSLMTSGMSDQKSDPSRMASKMADNLKSNSSRVEPKLSAAQLFSDEKEPSTPCSRERRRVSEGSPTKGELSVTDSKHRSRSKKRTSKSREASPSSDGSSTQEELSVKKSKGKDHTDQDHSHRSKSKERSRKSRKSSPSSDGSSTEEELSVKKSKKKEHTDQHHSHSKSKKRTNKSRESSLSSDSSSTEEELSDRHSKKSTKSKKKKHRSSDSSSTEEELPVKCSKSKKKHGRSDSSSAEEEPSANKKKEDKKHSHKSTKQSKKHRGSDDSSTQELSHHKKGKKSKKSKKSKHKSHSRKKSVTSSSSSDTDSDSDMPVKKKKSSPALKSAPKLFYDGKEEWDIFEDKFNDYAEQMDWTPSECKACLKWCLRGKASKFCSSLLKTNEDLTYKQLLTRLGDRFGDVDLNAAARAKLNSATQKKDESLEDWADRVRDLAAKAFKKLPEEFLTEEAVQRFCEGMSDGDAGHNVILQEPKTLEQAVKRTRLFQYTKSSCSKAKTGRGRTTRVTAEDYDEVPEVCAIAEQSEMSAVLRQMEEQRKLLDQLVMEKSQPKYYRYRKPIKDDKRACFHCQQIGHIMRDCELYKESLKGLNEPGASPGATTCTQKKEGPNQGGK